MDCRQNIEKLAYVKLAEARCLLDNNFFDGAYYLGGYTIELLLKSCVCETLGMDDFFNDGSLMKRLKFPQTYRVHNLEQLIVLSGVYKPFDAIMDVDKKFKTNWSIVQSWDEESRYLTGKTKKEAEDFLISTQEIAQWIQKQL